MTNVYIVNSPYHLLITLAKTLLAHREGKDELIVENPQAIQSQCLHNASHLFKRIIVINPIIAYFHVLIWRNRVTKRVRLLRNMLQHFLQIDEAYFRDKEIFMYYDCSALGCLLNNAQIEYNLIEDGLNRFQHDLACLFPHRSIFSPVWDTLLGVSWKSFGQSKYTKSIEVNDGDNLCLDHPNIVVANRNQMFNSLTEEGIDILANIYGYQPMNCPVEGESTLLLTQPLSEDQLLKHAKKIALYKYLAYKYGIGKLYVKPHPREQEDYTKVFPNAIILQNDRVPFEICQLKDKFHFTRAITAFSTVIDTLFCADEKIRMGQEWTLNFHDDAPTCSGN